MREIGITDSKEGIETTFDAIMQLAENCRFKDCTHTTEKGCAVIEALEAGELNEASYQNYLKMEREKQHYEASVADKRKRDKNFGKMVKEVMKHKKRNKLK